MKNELLKLEIASLLKERENLFYDLRQIGFNHMNWVNAEMNANKRILDINFRIDLLLSQIIE